LGGFDAYLIASPFYALIWQRLMQRLGTAKTHISFENLSFMHTERPTSLRRTEASELVLSLDQQTFWDLDVSRELLFLLTDRWLEFSDEMRAMLIDRIFTGPDRRPHWSDEDYPSSVSGA
jgi:hypothetical protein